MPGFLFSDTMKVPSNRLADIVAYYAKQLERLYDAREAGNIVRQIVEFFLGIDRLRLALEPELRVSESAMLEVHFAVKEVLKGRPLQYVTGIAWFDGKAFAVNENVLIPRPETEGLLGLVSDFLTNHPDARVLDACTGSGCIAISLKLRHPECSVVATDFSPMALQLAAANAVRHGVQIVLLEEDLLTGHKDTGEGYNLILSNPPYVPEKERSTLMPHVLAEPWQALFVPDDDPLIFYQALALLAQNMLKAGGAMAVECHSLYAGDVAGLFKESGLTEVKVLKDLHGRDRYVTACKSS
ncbi:MAG TPA: peptide chain release factor N(5)-glutamine methyltransferase [Bacteroidales bacterium]|nr:peptide chain release factor N(5)-glutamine methyltransferase [Bacteroidales bacterium]